MYLFSWRMAKGLVLYYLLALAFAAITYSAFTLLWGPIKLTFTAWLVSVYMGFTIGYVPALIKHVKASREKRGGG